MIHIISIKVLKGFCIDHAQYLEGIKAWITIVESCDWKKPQDIVQTFGPNNIDILGKNDRVVFDVKGNNIRIIAKYRFHKNLKQQILYIKWIGTHSEYTKICKKNLQYDVDLFG